MQAIFNKCQTPLEELHLEDFPNEIVEQFWDFLNNVPFIRWMVSPDRPLISELPRDEYGRAIIDVTKPPILEGSDYFRETARIWQETGKYTQLRPNSNPNSEFGRWLREERRRGWEGYVNPETGMWVTGDHYWLLNYCPMHLVVKRDDGLEMRATRHPKFWDGQFFIQHYILQSRMHAHHSAYLASRGKGKAHPYSQIVYTPEGVKLWGDIQVGDTLFGDDGLPTRVTEIPFDEEEKIYTVTLSDGRKLQCTSGHNFLVRDHRKHPNMRVADLWEIMHTDYAHKRKDGGMEYYYAIPNNKKVEFEGQRVLIDPYTLGLLLGDGNLTKAQVNTVEFTSGYEDAEVYRHLIPYEIIQRKAKYSHGIKIPNVENILKEYRLFGTLSHTKFIPKEYLFNTSEVRMAILQGIMDTDGTVNNNGVPMLTTTSERLANDIRWLCHSLGYNSTMFTKQGKYKDDTGTVHICKMTYNVTILTNDPIFKLQRKLIKLTNFESAYSRSRKDWIRIVDIKYSHRERAKCVKVDNESHCYLIGDFIVTHNTGSGASMLAKRFIIGESKENREDVQCMVTAADKTKLSGTNQILDVFVDDIDFCAKNTQFSSRRLKSSKQELEWEMGYKKSGSDVAYGSRNSVSGIISGVNQDKLNGSRGVLYLIEEAGIFKNLLAMYNMIRPSVEQGSSVFGQIICYGTSGDDMSDFTAFQEIFYSPEGYNMEGLDNVFDKEGQGRKRCCMFYPVYLNYDDTCIDADGNSDVTKALLKVLNDRYKVKHGTTDINTITKRISQYPITPQEAIIRSQGNVFPVTELNERLNQIDNNPNEYDDVYVGDLTQEADGKVKFVPNGDMPIRDFPTKDNKVLGALEIFSMPQKNPNGKVPFERYLISLDPFDADVSNTMSLGSCLVLDTWTDTIVAEYTGRPMFAEDLYEKVRLLCLFYNTKCMYEQNILGTFSYFSSKNSTHLLADTPEYLKERQLVSNIGYGNKAHPYSEKVYTPNGIKTWGEIQVGDKLFSSYGTETTVTDIPFDAVANIYEITLRDGRKVRASANHLWRVIDYNDLEKVLTTQQMLEKGYLHNKGKYNESKFYIPKNAGVDFPKQELPLPPYFMGLMFGDGCFARSLRSRANFASSCEDLEIYKQYVPFECKTMDDRHHWWTVPNIGEILRSLNLHDKKSHDKFIPDIYKYGSREDRLELLQGMCDTDGHIDYGGNTAYSTVSKRLCDDIMEIARSLGINCSYQIRHNSYGEYYKVLFYTDIPLFKLPRKRDRQAITKKRSFKTGIVDIKYVGQEIAKCVTVDSKDSCYLIGDFIVTHNSKGIRATTPIINGAFKIINSWLRKPVVRIEKDTEGNETEVVIPNLYFLRNRALIKELIQWNPYGNYDRVLSLVQLILYREEKMVLMQGDLRKAETEVQGMEADDYWTKNYPGKKNTEWQ